MSKLAVLSSPDAVQAVALAARDLAKRAQPQTVASRLTLRDLQDALTHMARAAHELGDGIEDRWAEGLPPNLRSVARQAGAMAGFAGGLLDDALAATGRDLHALRRRNPAHPEYQQSQGRRWLVRAADRFLAQCQHLHGGGGELGAARPDLLRGTCANFGSAVNHVAFLTDAACERSLGRTSLALVPLIQARREIDRARHRADVLCASLR